MKRYFWKQEVKDEGATAVVSVYEQCRDGSFYFIDSYTANRGTYRGGYAIACQILHDQFGYQWVEPDGHTHYMLKRRDIKLIELP